MDYRGALSINPRPSLTVYRRVAAPQPVSRIDGGNLVDHYRRAFIQRQPVRIDPGRTHLVGSGDAAGWNLSGISVVGTDGCCLAVAQRAG